MIDINMIASFFPANLQGNTFKEFMLKEYIQYQILDIIFNSKYKDKLVFIGGTSLRILYDIQRFSEDIDFDCKDLSAEDFDDLITLVAKELTNSGFNVIVKKKKDNPKRTAFQSLLHFPELMFNLKLSPHKEKRFLIKIDSEDQKYSYKTETTIIQKFDIITPVKHPPLPILLSMKIQAFMQRKKTRDIYDMIFLMGRTKPDYLLLDQKFNITNQNSLQEHILNRLSEFDLNYQINDIKQFLFNPKEINRIMLFKDYITNNNFQ